MTFNEYKQLVASAELSDYSKLLNLGRKWKRIDDDRTADTKIAILGSKSIQLIVSVMRALLCKYDIYADVYEGEYDGIVMEVYNDSSGLYSFNPSYAVIIPDYRDIESMCPRPLEENDAVIQQVKKATEQYISLCKHLNAKLPGCQIFLANFVEPVEDCMGNMAGNALYSHSQFYRQVNLELVKERPRYVTIVDIDKLASNIGKLSWFDPSAYFLNKSGAALEYIGFYCDAFARQFEAARGSVKKCLVLDLDNTLWGGVVGDLGCDGINVDPNDPIGEAFLDFQSYLLMLKNRGILLAVCSKNDIENAKEPFEKNEHMRLKISDFSAFVANWQDKAKGIKQIAQELNIGLDSIVFFDDNPTERALVKEFLPQVKVVEVPEDQAFYKRVLDQAFCFEWSQITDEDLSRVNSYHDNTSRAEMLAGSTNYDEFLQKLQMTASWDRVTSQTMERFAQLTNKSNQFNLRTMRYSDAEIQQLNDSKEYELYTVSLKDVFSNYGVIACVVLYFTKDICMIENWVMSCRVLKKTVENFTISKIVETALNRGMKHIVAEYRKSDKNKMVRELYEELGFEIVKESEELKEYKMDLSQFASFKINHAITEER